jgi:copper oxidase (laccase) domain-containing protein
MSLVVRSSLLEKTGLVRVGASTAEAGNMSYIYGPEDEVLAARRTWAEAMGMRLEDGVMYRPLDQDVIMDVDEAQRGTGMVGGEPLRADALVTRTPGLTLFLLLADCQGIAMLDPVQRVVALGHSSRKSTDLKLAGKMMNYLQHSGCRAEDILVYLTPSIGPQSYLFPSEIATKLTGWGDNVKVQPDGRYSVNVRGYVTAQLVAAGVKPEHIDGPAVDTFTEPTWYSHVRSAKTGEPERRFAVSIELLAT